MFREHRVCVLSFEYAGARRRVGERLRWALVIGPETMAVERGCTHELGYGYRQTLDTDRLRMWTDISDSDRLVWMWTDIFNTDSRCGQTFRIWTLGCGQTFRIRTLDADRHLACVVFFFFSSLLFLLLFPLRLYHDCAFVNLQKKLIPICNDSRR